MNTVTVTKFVAKKSRISRSSQLLNIEIFLCLKDDMQRFFTKLMQNSFLAAYCSINPSV